MNLRVALLAMALLILTDICALAIQASPWMIPAAIAGWYAADLMSGAVHMYMDYRECRPGLGLADIFHYAGSRESAEYLAMRDTAFRKLKPIERLVYDFKNHHPRPDALGRRSMLTQIGSTVLFATLPFAVLMNLAFWLLALPLWLLAGGVAFTIGSTFAQYFHGTLHRDDNPWPVRVMRRSRLLMRPEGHVLHHETLTQDFSTINGWSNPALNRIFRALRRRGRMPDERLVPR